MIPGRFAGEDATTVVRVRLDPLVRSWVRYSDDQGSFVDDEWGVESANDGSTRTGASSDVTGGQPTRLEMLGESATRRSFRLRWGRNRKGLGNHDDRRSGPGRGFRSGAGDLPGATDPAQPAHSRRSLILVVTFGNRACGRDSVQTGSGSRALPFLPAPTPSPAPEGIGSHFRGFWDLGYLGGSPPRTRPRPSSSDAASRVRGESADRFKARPDALLRLPELPNPPPRAASRRRRPRALACLHTKPGRGSGSVSSE